MEVVKKNSILSIQLRVKKNQKRDLSLLLNKFFGFIFLKMIAREKFRCTFIGDNITIAKREI